MNTRKRILICGFALFCLLGRAQDDFVDLLASTDLSEWVEEFHARARERAAAENLTAFSLRDGILHCDGSVGNIGFIRHKQQFCDFELRVEFRAPEGTNNGICFRAPSYTAKTPAHTGFELQLWLKETDNPTARTGAFYSVNPPLATVRLAPEKWHTARIVCDGPRIRAWLDGALVQDFDQSAHELTKDRPRCGYIFFQSHGGDMDLRNVRIRKLP